jgi:hypothetical protein
MSIARASKMTPNLALASPSSMSVERLIYSIFMTYFINDIDFYDIFHQ